MWVGCASNQPTNLEARRFHMKNCKWKYNKNGNTDSSFNIKDYHKDPGLFPEYYENMSKTEGMRKGKKKYRCLTATEPKRVSRHRVQA